MTDFKAITDRLTAHYEQTLAEHGDSERGHDWGEGTEWGRFMVMCDVAEYNIRDNQEQRVLLDYGCGTGRCLDIAMTRGYQYSGCDGSQEMITAAIKRIPFGNYFHGDILTTPDIFDEYDYTIVNGVFTQKLDINDFEWARYWSETLKALWKITRRGIAVNFMSTVVDETRDNLCHLDMEALLWFAWKELGTRNVVFRNDYGLFEYTAYIYK